MDQFIFAALGFRCPSVTNNTVLRPRPLPLRDFIDLPQTTPSLKTQSYTLAYVSDEIPPWSCSGQNNSKRYYYPVRHDGYAESWSFRNFRYLSGVSKGRIWMMYKLLVDCGKYWAKLEAAILKGYARGEIDLPIKETWQELRRPVTNISHSLYWERKSVNDALLLAVVIHERWGFETVNGEYYDMNA